ncbi:MAG: HvfB family MNIO-type RiPP peptide maturase [Gammaproteobacteria bacterium]
MGPLADQLPEQISFFEVAPENWIGVGGRFGKQFHSILEHYPLVCHGLSLSIGSPAPLDEKYLYQLKDFLDEHDVAAYSEHLSYCSDDGHLYDLMPIPFTEGAVHYVADRIRKVQDILERPLIIENVSYYAAPSKEMDEIEFLRAVLEEADCELLLDVNNIYVNSINHRYDPEEFLYAIPASRVAYFHVAGHYKEAEDLRIDTHAAPVNDPVWSLLDKAYAHFGAVPTLLERDFNIPPLEELLAEVDRIVELQKPWLDNLAESAVSGG